MRLYIFLYFCEKKKLLTSYPKILVWVRTQIVDFGIFSFLLVLFEKKKGTDYGRYPFSTQKNFWPLGIRKRFLKKTFRSVSEKLQILWICFGGEKTPCFPPPNIGKSWFGSVIFKAVWHQVINVKYKSQRHHPSL